MTDQKNMHTIESVKIVLILQGRVKFPIGGIVREPRSGRIWCDSKTDSIVWMEEDG